jgi:hypothetical protein
MLEEKGDRRPTKFLRHLQTLAGSSVPSDVLLTSWTKRLPPKIQAIIDTQAQVPLDDVAQLADKTAEVAPSPCVARVSSSGDISTLTARIDELAREVAALFACASRPRSPSQTRQHARRSSRSAGRSTGSAGTTSVLKSVKRDALRPVRGSRETWMAVASGSEQLQQLSQKPACDGSAHKDKLLGRHRRRSLRLPPIPSSRTPEAD